ncbi:hypothetical protein ACMHYO_11540 [Allopusillimonas ginsengisoli]|uniref:hypothetical protein n=1 Tax=Allopusillimonas ginsengisoli TaxID=453575 RepID=UPI0039C35014
MIQTETSSPRPVAAPKPDAPFDNTQAVAEGWFLATMNNTFHIEPMGEDAVFDDGVAATIHVAEQAKTGSEYHIRALALLGTRADNPGGFLPPENFVWPSRMSKVDWIRWYRSLNPGSTLRAAKDAFDARQKEDQAMAAPEPSLMKEVHWVKWYRDLHGTSLSEARQAWLARREQERRQNRIATED